MNPTEIYQPRATPVSATPSGVADPAIDDPRVLRAVEEFLAAQRAGQRLDRREFLSRHLDVAAALADCLDGLEFIQAAAPQLSEPALATALVTAQPELQPEGPLGDYRIVRELGRGGMGVVYEAVQISLGRRVALKVLPFAAALDGRQLQRFKNEAQAAAHLHHQNIVPVYGVGCERGVHYYAMQFIDGQTLAAMIAALRPVAGRGSVECDGSTGAAGALADELLSGRWAPSVGRMDHPTDPAPAAETPTLPVAALSTEHSTRSPAYFRTVASLGVQAAQALEHAHGQGVVHRDIKPANLLLDGRGNLWITDFGLAHCQNQAGLTMTGDLVGTLRYMSPEQALAQRVVIDHRTDIYSLGTTLYELLALEPVFDGRDRQELLRQIAFEEPRLPRRVNPAIPAELETIVLKALEKNPADRYATAQELADDLERFLKDEPIRAKRPTLWQRSRKWVRRHPSIFWSALAATVVVLLMAVGMLALGYQRAYEEQKRTEQSLAEKTELLWQSYLSQAQARRYSRQMGQREGALAALAEAACIRPDERLRDEAIAAIARPDLRLGPTWKAWPAGTKGFAFDGLYRVYARADGHGVISIRSIPDDQEIQRIVSAGPEWARLWLSADGRFLARILDEEHTLRVWRVADGQRVLRAEPRKTAGWAFSPDSRQLAVGQEGWVLCFDLTKGEEVNRWRLPSKANALAFHPDNRTLAVGYASGNIASVYDTKSGKRVTDLPVGSISQQTVAWHPDGERLAVAGSDPRIQIWDVAAKRRLATLEGHVQHVTVLSFHPDGELLASTSWDGMLRLWHPASGRPLLQLPMQVYAQFSSDGRWLGFARQGEQGQLLEVTPCREYRTLVSSLGAGQGGYYYGDISPDGRLLAVGMDDATRLWDLHTGRELATLPGDTRSAFFDRIGPRWELLTDGANGLRRWPVQKDEPLTLPSPLGGEGRVRGGQRLRLGPPRQLSPLYRADFARSPQGRTLAAVYAPGTPIQVFDLERDAVRQNLGVHPLGTGQYALSADGRWVASCGWHSDKVRVWNTDTGKMVHEWDQCLRARVFFTPDSRALVICLDDEYSFWDVDTWRPIRRLQRNIAENPGFVAFAPDGRLMAMEMAPAVIHLKEVATGRTVAKLEDPHGDLANWIGFTPDGTQLVTTTSYARAVHIWDLRAIRARLKAMRLDWDWPEYGPPDPGSKAVEPLTVEALLGDPANLALTREQTARHAIERYRQQVAASPKNATACNNLAWAYLSAPAALRDVKAALPLAEKAVRLDAGSALYRNTLGLAYYRNTRFREAVEILRPNLDSQEDWGLAFDLYILAMSHHGLGETARAQDYYALANRWKQAQKGLSTTHLEELNLFQAEAAELLGIDKKKD